MKRFFVFVLVFLLTAGLCSCGAGEETEGSVPESDSSSESVSEETPESESNAESSSETASVPEPVPDANNGVLINRNLYPDYRTYSNKSVPYGNDWEDKDAAGLPNGIHYYESLYHKFGQPIYRIPTDKKTIYLTFDEGYEAGYTPKILDTLKEKNVKAVFFITKQFFDSDPELIQRMIDEGHVIGNHSCAHPAGGFPKYVDENGVEAFDADLSKLHKLVYDRFGYTMELFRFPEGESSEMLLAEAANLGYTSVFWSYAHKDYVQTEQPEVSVTLDRCLSHMAPGAVYLLHAVSSANTEALGGFIDGARKQGYDFSVIPVAEYRKR